MSTHTPTLAHLNPADLVIGANVRLDARLDASFVASIKAHGVLEPIVAVRDGDTTTVRYGQRRTLAAVEAGLTSVPVVLVDPADETQRIVEQLAENDHRAGITDRERVEAYTQLAGFGLTAAQIAKATARDKTEVTRAAAVAASPTAAEATTTHDFLTLEDAAYIAEFEDDPADVEKILKAASDGWSTAQAAQRIRDDRAERAAEAAARGQLEETGVTVIDRPSYDEKRITALSRLRAAAGSKKAITPKDHAACPGHVAWITKTYAVKGGKFEPVYGCSDPGKHGHVKTDAYGDTTRPAGPMTDEQKAERRQVIENNKAWDAAEKVRAGWLAEFAKGTTAPKGVEAFIAVEVATGETAESSHKVLPKVDPAKIGKASGRAALRATAALLLADWHAKAGRHTWRNPTARDRRALAACIEWGYKPSELEAGIVKGSK